MKRGFLKQAALLSGVAAAAASWPALAHHSAAIYDHARVITLKGEVKAFQWTNPHCVIWFVVKPERGGAPQEWAVESTSPGVLTRSGWTRNSVKPGDHVAVEFYPLRDGSHGGGLKTMTLLDTGQTLTAGSPKDPPEKEKADSK
jgi:hypothetical protein